MKRIAIGLGDERGFTLVEMLIAIVILFILLVGVLYFFEFGLRNAKTTQARSILNIEASNTMEKMVRQLRCANSFTVPTVTSPMTGNPTFLRGDVKGDGTNSSIMFYRTTENALFVYENGITPDTKMASNVTALTFTYYDSDGQPLGSEITEANRTLIKRVEISLTMLKAVGSGGSTVTTTKTGSVLIRSELSRRGDMIGECYTYV